MMTQTLNQAQGVSLYEAMTRVRTRDLNLGTIRSREDAQRYFPDVDDVVFEVILDCARSVYTTRTGSRVRDVVAKVRQRVARDDWARWSGAIAH